MCKAMQLNLLYPFGRLIHTLGDRGVLVTAHNRIGRKPRKEFCSLKDVNEFDILKRSDNY